AHSARFSFGRKRTSCTQFWRMVYWGRLTKLSTSPSRVCLWGLWPLAGYAAATSLWTMKNSLRPPTNSLTTPPIISSWINRARYTMRAEFVPDETRCAAVSPAPRQYRLHLPRVPDFEYALAPADNPVANPSYWLPILQA